MKFCFILCTIFLCLLKMSTSFGGIVSGNYLVKFKNTDDFYDFVYFSKINGSGQVEILKDFTSFPLLKNVYLDKQNYTFFINTLASSIEYIEPVYTLEDFSREIFYRDTNIYPPISDKQWALKNANDIDIDAEEAWNLTRGQSSVVVGVIDSGVDLAHPAFAQTLWTNPDEIPNNSIDDDQNGFIDDVYGPNLVRNTGNPQDDKGHGTLCAGIVAGNDGVYFGAAPEIKVAPLKFSDASSGGNTATAILAIDYAILKNIKILSLSWGTKSYSQSLYEAIQKAADHNIFFVSAAGNDGTDNDQIPTYPANYSLSLPNIIAVANIQSDGKLASSSSYGAESVQLAAPGTQIYTPLLGGGYDYKSGTSASAPFVASVAALVLSYYPQMGYQELKNQLLHATDSLSSLQQKTVTGGSINAYKALTYGSVPTPLPTPIPTPIPTPVASECSENSSTKVSVEFQNFSTNSIDLYWVNFSCQEIFMKTLLPNKGWRVSSYKNHVWVSRKNSSSKLIKSFKLTGASSQVIKFK